LAWVSYACLFIFFSKPVEGLQTRLKGIQMNNAMTEAFIKAGIKPKNDRIGRFYSGHSTKLSYRTYQALKAQGVLE
jgi:hypothetical protein